MPNVVTSIDVPLGQSVHVIIDNQAGGHLLPGQIAWDGDMGQICSRTADQTGFNFHGVTVGSVVMTASRIGDPALTTTLTVNVTDADTGLEVEQG